MMNSIVAGVRREYWEHKNMIIGLPLIISALSIIAFIGVILTTTYSGDDNKASSSSHSQKSHAGNEFELSIELGADDHSKVADSIKKDSWLAQNQVTSFGQRKKVFSFEFIEFLISASWFTCIYYLLSCLYSDRKDKSILFWKSLPVSETQNVLTKLLVACVGFISVSIVIAWLSSVVFLALFVGANALGVEGVNQHVGLEFNAVKFFLWPLVSMMVGLIWGAPVFAYVLMISAAARRSPFLLLVVPLLVLLILEGMFFKSSHLIEFFSQHLPFDVLDAITDSTDIGSFLHYYFIENGLSLVVGLTLAVVFTSLAIWCRNNRFEI